MKAKIFWIFLFIRLTSFAHSVQVQYCVSCNGDLRVWVEHWHGAEDPSSTTMSITVDINGVASTYTAPPAGVALNMPSEILPGCSTPIVYAVGCPGNQNTFNDWVYYDFVGIPQNVPITITIVSGNSVFTQDACGMYPFSFNFNINGNISQLSNQTICSGSPTNIINLPPTATWTNSNPSIGIPDAGVGSIASFSPIGPPGTIATISYVNGCGSGNFDFVIGALPEPNFSTLSNGVSSLNTCLGNSLNFLDSSTIAAPNTITNWLWDFGDGNTLFNQNPSHTYSQPGTYLVNLTVSSDAGCGSTSSSFPITVFPIPIANFTFDTVCANMTTTFNDLSTITNSTISGWNWDILNDNSIDYSTQNITHTFTAGGTYDVSLTVVSADGCISPELIQTVDVNYIPTPSFSTDSVCVGLTSTFTDASIVTNATIIDWNWQFGDGNVDNGTPTTNIYPNSGDYLATIEVTSSAGCVASTSGNVYVKALPISDFSITEACYYDAVTTNNLSAIGTGTMTYSWDFGDASAPDVNTSPDNNYTASGVYDVTLTATSNFGCVHTVTNPVNIYDKPIADYSVGTVCLNINSYFNDNSSISNVINGDVISSWNWDINGDNSFEYTSQNPQHLFPSEGGFNTTLIATTAFGCKDTVNLPVDVWPLPQVDFDFTDLCLNDITNFNDLSTISNTYTTNSNSIYDWDFGDSISGNGVNPTHIFSTSGDFNVDLTVTSNNGCINDLTQVVNIRPLPAPEFTSTSTCINTPPTTFTSSTTIPVGVISQLQWDFGDGNIGNGEIVTNIYPVAGIYNTLLTATSTFGCVDSISHPTIVHEKPTAIFTSNETLACAPGTIEFSDLSYSNTTSIDALKWNFFNGNTTDIQNPITSYSNETEDISFFDVELIVTNSYGCNDTIYVEDYITIIPQPKALFSFSPSLLTVNETEIEFSNQSTNADQYFWSFGDNSTSSNQLEPTHEYINEPNSYTVELIAFNHGQLCSDTTLAIITIDDIILFYMPNVFTPDQGNINNTWKPVFTSGYDPYEFHLIVFNRWGEVVWESFNSAVAWNGYYSNNEKLIEDGVYVWHLVFKETMSDKKHEHFGFVTVIK